ncbi:MAG: hypothetical protein JXR96_17060 [Deltaproteobacteria bacterium]|nr:hypothetical protein [Deltaproteobacteria bacterium]
MTRRRMSLASFLAALLGCPLGLAQTVTLSLDDAVIAPRTRLGIGVNGGGSWTNFVGAILVDDPSFEGPEDGNGFARDGWPWYSGGDLSAAVDGQDFVSGAQSQRVTVSAAGAYMAQGRDSLPQAPLFMTARPDSTYRIRVQVKADRPDARIRLGVIDQGWGRVYGPDLPVGTSWQVVDWDYVPASEHLLRGISIQFADPAVYWLDDLVAWDTTDIDPTTGLSATYVARLRELAPASLRLGGLGVNGIPLESYLRRYWDPGYGPPCLQPDLDLNTFLLLCRELGAIPFITVPPAFSDASAWQSGDLSDHVIAEVYEDHGNLVDYLGGDASTAYGARRESDGFARWDQAFELFYFELGNELWGTPDDRWDMDPNGDEDLLAQMTNFATYNERRMSEMKARPGWRSNMRVGFCGRGPSTWIGGWPGSYDGTLIPAIGALTDFSTIDLYYGSGEASDGDEAIFGALFANAQIHEREIAAMKAAFRQANGGVDIETTVYEGNATWGGYESDLGNPSPLYYKSVSLGAAVSLLDVYAAANRAGVTVNNHFHYGGNVWGATGPYPDVLRKPAFFALELFNTELAGDLVGCAVSGAGSWDDALIGEQGVPYVACYPYLQDDVYRVLLINRHRTDPVQVRFALRLAPQRAVWLSAAEIDANNELAETVSLRAETLSGELEDEPSFSLPPFTAVVLALGKSGQPPRDGGQDGGVEDAGGEDGGLPDSGDPGPGADAGGDAGKGPDGGSGGDSGGQVIGSCGCGAGGRTSGLAPLLALWLLRWRQRRPSSDRGREP